MATVARIKDLVSRTAGTSDLSSWARIVPATPNDRDGVMVCNQSSNHLFIAFVGSSDSDPSGTDTSDADAVVAPGSTAVFDVGSSVDVFGLHGSPLVAGYAVREVV